jgi:hypothetical protein
MAGVFQEGIVTTPLLSHIPETEICSAIVYAFTDLKYRGSGMASLEIILPGFNK